MLSHFLLCYPQTDIQTDTQAHILCQTTECVAACCSWDCRSADRSEYPWWTPPHHQHHHHHTHRSSYNRYMSISTTLWIKMELPCTSFPLGRNTTHSSMVFPDTSGFFQQHNVLRHAEKTWQWCWLGLQIPHFSVQLRICQMLYNKSFYGDLTSTSQDLKDLKL